MIWPDLDRWRGRFGLAADQTNDLAAMGFTDLLSYLREVILQDSIYLMKQFPKSPVWNHPVFRHEAYSQFALQASALAPPAEAGDGERPSQLVLLAQAVPALADFLQSMDTRMADLKADLKADVQTGLQAIRGVESQGLAVPGPLGDRPYFPA
jgi:hypothetical protein